MGCSSRPDDYHRDLFDTDRSTEYFVEYLEKWRVEMDITNFYLAGHSFGGYIVGNYAVKYHKHLKKLILMSPIGVKMKTKEGERDLLKKFEGGKNGNPRCFRVF